jgi:hypothetical protein
MKLNLSTAAGAAPLTALILDACLSRSTYDAQTAQLDAPADGTKNLRIAVTVQGSGAAGA